MALPVRNQLITWGIAAALFFAAFWYLSGVLAPFIVGGAIAYFLDPVADRLERAGFSRVAATATIGVLALLFFVLISLAVVPLLVSELTQLINTAPEMATRLQGFLLEKFPALQDGTSTLRQSLAELGAAIQARGGQLVQGVLSSVLGVVNVAVFVVVAPVVAFYLLLDWDRMVGYVDNLLPLDHAPVVRRLMGEIDLTLAAFVRGQLSVCLAMGVFYATSLMAIGLNFGLVVGAIAGAITFIPFVGAILGGGIAVALALFQFWGDWVSIGLVIGVFVLGQVLEGYVFTPRLVGKSVGLHPVWLMAALTVFGALMGFVGMLIAVPVAAAIGVLIRYGLGRYQESKLYIGYAGRIPEDEDQA
jgi:predicted PurR-regulated permease PerM